MKKHLPEKIKRRPSISIENAVNLITFTINALIDFLTPEEGCCDICLGQVGGNKGDCLVPNCAFCHQLKKKANCCYKNEDCPVCPKVSTPDKWEEIERKYSELLMAVSNKFEGETRHETALKYIKNAELTSGELKANLLQAGE